MTGIGKVDQAIVLLKDRLLQLKERGKAGVGGAARNAAALRAGKEDPLHALRELVRRGQIDEHELRRALVRILLANSLGDELVASIEFQSIMDEVARMLEDSEIGNELLARALAELG